MCWDDTPAGVLSFQLCPDYFPDFDPMGKVFAFILYLWIGAFGVFIDLKIKSDMKCTYLVILHGLIHSEEFLKMTYYSVVQVLQVVFILKVILLLCILELNSGLSKTL
jgi:hypothetical protein